LSTLGEMMRSSGHTVTPNGSAPTALRDYASGRFDVVVTYIGMAEMNGWEFAERLRAVDARVPLLFITGWGLREEDHARLAGLGVRRRLFKPIRPDELDAARQAAIAAAIVAAGPRGAHEICGTVPTLRALARPSRGDRRPVLSAR